MLWSVQERRKGVFEEIFSCWLEVVFLLAIFFRYRTMGSGEKQIENWSLLGGVKHEKKRGLKNLNPWVKKLNHGLKTQK